jgi:hypothetical protein
MYIILRKIILIIFFCIFLSCTRKNPKEINTPIVEENQKEILVNNTQEDNSNKNNTATKIEMENIEGHYVNYDDSINLIIIKDDNGYKYKIVTPNRNLEGKINISDDLEYFILDGIQWASWEIDEIPQELPESVSVYIDENDLIIQNYGNSMNNYVIFDDIGEKYINLTKK